MFSTLNNTCGKTVLMMEEQQGLCHLSLYSKVVFSKVLDHATPPLQIFLLILVLCCRVYPLQ